MILRFQSEDPFTQNIIKSSPQNPWSKSCFPGREALQVNAASKQALTDLFNIGNLNLARGTIPIIIKSDLTDSNNPFFITARCVKQEGLLIPVSASLG